MSNHGLYSVEDTAKAIAAGHVLLIAGDEALLKQLPPGKWIGGTSANFMAPEGGVTERERLFVTDITSLAGAAEVHAYSIDELPKIASHYPANGFTVLIVPGLSPLHEAFAKGVQNYESVFNAPLFGWISGVHVSEIGVRAPLIFVGDGQGRTDRAAAIHVSLPADQIAKIDIVNLFVQGDGVEIEFPTGSFETVGECLIDGKPGNLAALIGAESIDTRLPLVADYNGAMINVSLREVDAKAGRVAFYAPVFEGVKYRFAKPVPSYTDAFGSHLSDGEADKIVLSCNCILNYLYADLEGKRTGTLLGPITFGEIAYMLLNQTLVYLSLEKAA